MDSEIIGYVMGFIDAEASFSVSVKLQNDMVYGVRIDPVFSVTQQDREPLRLIMGVIGAGRVIRKPGQRHLWLLVIGNMKELKDRLVPFIDEHVKLLIAKKRAYEIFREIVLRISNGEHRNLDGLKAIVVLAYRLSELSSKARRRKGLNQVLDIINSRAAKRGEPPGDR